MSDEADLVDSVVAASQEAEKLRAQNKALRESLKAISKISFDIEFGEGAFDTEEEVLRKKIRAAEEILRRECFKHGIY